MIDAADLEEAIIEMAKEDWCGLYEIIWHMNKVQPDIPEIEKIEAARSVVESLLKRGAIQLGWLEWPQGVPPAIVSATDTAQLLNDLKSWQPSQRYLVVWSDR